MSRIAHSLIIVCLCLTGCMHHRLGYNTVRQAQTVSDVHTQQVLDNVAKFVHNRHALPHFSYPNQGGTSVRDQRGGDAGFNFSPFALLGWDLGFDGSRQDDESYTMTPINDPEKLALMRCAYQRAITGCCCNGESGSCPNCEKRFNRFYLGSETTSQTGAVTPEGHAIYWVKDNVKLIYYPYPDAPQRSEELKEKDYRHYVAAERNAENKAIYTYLGSENLIDRSESQFIPVGTPVFKLADATVIPTTPSEIKKFKDRAAKQDFEFKIYEHIDGIWQVVEWEDLDHHLYREPEKAEPAKDPEAIPAPASKSPKVGKRFPETTLDHSQAKEKSHGEAANKLRQSKRSIKSIEGKLYIESFLSSEKQGEKSNSTESGDSSLSFSIVSEDPSDSTEKSNKHYNLLKLVFQVPQPLSATDDLSRPHVENSLQEFTEKSGQVTPACLYSDCWFRVCKKGEIPRHCPCAFVGHYCGTYVWVPACGRDQLTKLTLTILGIATKEAASKPTTEVYAFLKEDGKTAATYQQAAFLAKGTVSQGSSPTRILPTSTENLVPPNQEKINSLISLRDEARTIFEQALKNAIIEAKKESEAKKGPKAKESDQVKPVPDIFSVYNQLSNHSTDQIQFVNSQYKISSLDVQDDDVLIRIAANFLSRKEKPKFVVNDASFATLTTTGRKFLEAEHRLQQIESEVPVLSGNGVIEGPRSRPNSELGAQVLRLMLQTETLGGLP